MNALLIILALLTGVVSVDDLRQRKEVKTAHTLAVATQTELGQVKVAIAQLDASIAAQPNVPVGFVSTPAFISRNTGMAQGYTTDGTYHYVISTTSLIKCLDNAGWTVIATNSTPFAGLTGYSHLGDGCYYNGKLYVAGEYYNSCADFSSQSIFVFNASDLSRDSVHNNTQRELSTGGNGDRESAG